MSITGPRRISAVEDGLAGSEVRPNATVGVDHEVVLRIATAILMPHPPTGDLTFGSWTGALRSLSVALVLAVATSASVADCADASYRPRVPLVTCRKPRSVPIGEREVGRIPRIRTEASR